MKRLVCVAFTALAMLAAIDLTPFNGAWKFNPQKSRLEGAIMKFVKAADGMLVQTEGAFETKFRVDGKDYPSPIGYTVAWKEDGKNAWRAAVKLNGKELFSSRFEIAPGDKTMTITSEGKKPNGDSFSETVRWARTAGGTGLIGTWRSEKVDTPAETILIQTSPSEFTFNIPQWQASAKVGLDGKQHPMTGPTIPPGFTISVRPVNSRTVETRNQKEAKLVATGRMEVSADGKTMTETSKPAGENRTVVYVYDKQ